MSSASVAMSMLIISVLGHRELSGPSRQVKVGWTEGSGKRTLFDTLWHLVDVTMICTVFCAETSVLIFLGGKNISHKVILVVSVVFTKGVSGIVSPTSFILIKHVILPPFAGPLELFSG